MVSCCLSPRIILLWLLYFSELKEIETLHLHVRACTILTYVCTPVSMLAKTSPPPPKKKNNKNRKTTTSLADKFCSLTGIFLLSFFFSKEKREYFKVVKQPRILRRRRKAPHRKHREGFSLFAISRTSRSSHSISLLRKGG